ncbi:MAG: glycoside hydrolase family 1 protein [Acidobacteria bacterium]|nr:glycoside hydrolase family 1 protein [Acidobacteriota bacterium]
MSNPVLETNAKNFLWASGIEDTFVPQTKVGHRALDEYELMGHYEHWRDDLALLRECKMQGVRWGVPWYRVEPAPGEFDWRWTDQVLPYIVEELGITPIIDLMHYGCPFWLRREFANDQYATAVSHYAEAFARRYHHLIKFYTPLNEPLVNALMCGKRGVWPPYWKGDSGYVRVMLQIVRGVINTVEKIKQVDPSAVIVQVEATGLNRAVRHDLEILAIEDQRRGYLFYDLITGAVNAEHPLYGWLLRNGAAIPALEEVQARRLPIEVLGMNFYPQWSTQQVYIDKKGRLSYRAIEHEGEGFASLIEDYYHRYQVPIMITETSAFGADAVRSRWLAQSVATVKQLREKGVPVIGYTWFPLFTMVDWRYRLGRRPIERYYIDLGLYKRQQEPNASRWQATSLVDQMQRYIQNPEAAIGHCLAPSQLTSESPNP